MFHVEHLPRGYIVREGEGREFYRVLPIRRFMTVQITTDGDGVGSKLVKPVSHLVIDYVCGYDSGGSLAAWRLWWENNRGSTPDFLAVETNTDKVYPRANQLLTTAADLYQQVPWNMVLRKDDQRRFRVSGLTSGTVELTLLVRELIKVEAERPDFVEVLAATAEA